MAKISQIFCRLTFFSFTMRQKLAKSIVPAQTAQYGPATNNIVKIGQKISSLECLFLSNTQQCRKKQANAAKCTHPLPLVNISHLLSEKNKTTMAKNHPPKIFQSAQYFANVTLAKNKQNAPKSISNVVLYPKMPTLIIRSIQLIGILVKTSACVYGSKLHTLGKQE